MKGRARMDTVEVLNVIDEGGLGVKTLHFDLPQAPEMAPSDIFGSFFMIWLPGVGEVPLSVTFQPGYVDTPGPFGITILPIGPVTKALCEVKPGDLIGVRGPLGKGFQLKDAKNVLLVAGGIGVAPFGSGSSVLEGRNVTAIIGAQTAHALVFEDLAMKLGWDVHITTDDGSKGFKGFTTQKMDELDLSKFDLVLTCGPEIMMKGVVDKALAANVEVQASLERYMKCGVGVCDACAMGGFCICSDGPVFDGKQLTTIDEFGGPHRDASGMFQK